MTGTEIYKRTAAYEKQAREIKLLAPYWKLLLAYDGVRTVSEVALTAEVSFAEALPLTAQFLEKDWIEECPITLDQYLKRAGAKDLSSVGSTVSPAVVLHEPGKDKPAPPAISPAATIAAPSVAAPSVAAIHPPPPLPAAAVPLKPAAVEKAVAPETPPVKSTRGSMRLSAVVDFITSIVGNVALGQLLVYRVFLRVPPELLLAEDIASVHLVNDTSMIQGDKLQKAIADAVSGVTKRTLPDSVFAAA
jgi:hypothetical protein